MNAASSSDEVFFTPAELCARWKIDLKTLDKLDLPWCQLRPRIRRVRAQVVFSFEQAQRFEVD